MDYNSVTSEQFNGLIDHMRQAIREKENITFFTEDEIWDENGLLSDEVMAGAYAYFASDNDYHEYRITAIVDGEAYGIHINASDENEGYYFMLEELPLTTLAFIYFEYCKS